MNLRATISLLVVPLVAAMGCAQGEEAEQEQASQMQAAAETEMAEAGTRSLDLMALNNSGVTGTAELSHTADQMTVVLNLTGLAAGESYAAHIHEGTCEQGGPPVVTLNTVEAMDGTGTSETMVAMSDLANMEADEGMAEGEAMGQDGMAEGEAMGDEMMQDQGESYYIQVHNPDGSPAACVDIEAGETQHMMQ